MAGDSVSTLWAAVLRTIAWPLRHTSCHQGGACKAKKWSMQFVSKKSNSYCGREACTPDKIIHIQSLVSSDKPKTSLGPLLSASATVPGFAFFCRRKRWGRPGRNSGLKDWHGRTVMHSNGVNPLDYHLHVLPHRASLAQSLNNLQERKAVSCQNSWTSKTTQSITGSNLKGKKKKEKRTLLNINNVLHLRTTSQLIN